MLGLGSGGTKVTIYSFQQPDCLAVTVFLVSCNY